MKNLFKLIGFIALVAVIGFSMAACGGGGDGDGGNSVTYTGTADGTTYTLKIIEKKARYTAKEGDDYVLTAGKQQSRGSVENVEGDTFTLQPDNADTPFTAKVSEGGLTKLDGTITWTDKKTVSAPGTLTPKGSGGGGVTPGGGGGGNLGNSLSLSNQQVYIEDWDFTDGMKTTYTSYTGSIASFTSNVGGSGSIRNGKMSFSVGAPADRLLEPYDPKELADSMSEYNIYRDAKITPSDTRGVGLDFDIDLSRINMNMNQKGNSISATMEMVSYIYYDRDCTITATGGKITEAGMTMTVPNMNLKFKKGWNIIYIKATTSASTSTGASTGSIEIKQSDSSSCKWVIDSDDDDDDWW
jgi:hypothetical protein